MIEPVKTGIRLETKEKRCSLIQETTASIHGFWQEHSIFFFGCVCVLKKFQDKKRGFQHQLISFQIYNG